MKSAFNMLGKCIFFPLFITLRVLFYFSILNTTVTTENDESEALKDHYVNEMGFWSGKTRWVSAAFSLTFHLISMPFSSHFAKWNALGDIVNAFVTWIACISVSAAAFSFQLKNFHWWKCEKSWMRNSRVRFCINNIIAYRKVRVGRWGSQPTSSFTPIMFGKECNNSNECRYLPCHSMCVVCWSLVNKIINIWVSERRIKYTNYHNFVWKTLLIIFRHLEE